MRRLPVVVGCVALVAGLFAPATAYAQQSLNFYVGGFVAERGRRSARRRRSATMCCVNNLDFLAFDINDFNGGTVGAEYLVGLGEWLDAGLGVGIYKRTRAERLRRFRQRQRLRDRAGSEAADRAVHRDGPVPAARSHRAAVEPYIGAGVAHLQLALQRKRRLRRLQRQLDLPRQLRRQRARRPVRSSSAACGSRSAPLDVGGEVRYQNAEGDLPADQDFSADEDRSRRLDLRGHVQRPVLDRSRGSPVCDPAASRSRRRIVSAPVRATERRRLRRRARTRREIAGSRVHVSPACRRPRPSPRSASSRQTAADRSSAFSQMSPLPSCRKSRMAETAPRQVLHVVAERAHAGHDRLAAVAAAPGSASPARARRCSGRSHCASTTIGADASSGRSSRPATSSNRPHDRRPRTRFHDPGGHASDTPPPPR